MDNPTADSGSPDTYSTDTYQTWLDFLRDLEDDYLTMSRADRDDVIFRGQTRSSWPLQPTLDRKAEFLTTDHRERFIESLLTRFQEESYGVPGPHHNVERINDFEFIARHHGLPTRLLDWSKSPFIAAFFAFDELIRIPKDDWPDYVCVWYMLPTVMGDYESTHVEVLSPDHRANPRAFAQKSILTRLRTNIKYLDIALGDCAGKLLIPSSEYENAIQYLDEININAGTLFPDLDGQARSAERRYVEFRGE